MARVHCIRTLVILSLLVAWIPFPGTVSVDTSNPVADNIRGRIIFPDERLQAHLVEQPHKPRQQIGILEPQSYANTLEIFRQQSLFAPVFNDASATTTLLNLLSENVTRTCINHWGYALQKAFASPPKLWVIQMFDAFGKFPSGLLSGHLGDYGDFYECINLIGEYTPDDSTTTEVVKGRYLYTAIKLPPTQVAYLRGVNNGKNENIIMDPEPKAGASITGGGLGMGTCFPASCSTEDVQMILDTFHEFLKLGITQTVPASSYTSEKPAFDAGDYVMIVILILIGALCLFGTLWDFVGPSKGVLPQMLVAFSVYNNSKKWASTKAGSENLGCLHGLRFLSMAWVVLCHTYLILAQSPLWNGSELFGLATDYSLAPILNGSVSVDTFFTLSGTLVAYGLLKELERAKGRFNYGLFAVHRYLRITPVYAILVGVMATIVPYMGNGPNWATIDAESIGCEKHWWHNILYINNFFRYEAAPAMIQDDTMHILSSKCYSEGWYLAIDMQLYLLSPLIIYPLWRWKRVGFGLLGLLSIVSMIITAVITAEKDLPPTMVMLIWPKTFPFDIYAKPWTRAGPFLVGIGLGYLLHYRAQNKTNFPTLPKMAVAAGWLLSTALALTIIFAAMPFFDSANAEATYTAWYSVVYASLNRPVWGLVIAWISFACICGYGGWVNKFLSLKVFIPLGRLTFCVYLTSYHMQMLYHYSNPHSENFSQYRTVYVFFAHLAMSGLVSFILTVCVEAPFMQLEKMLFSPRKQAPRKLDPESNGIVSGQEITTETSDSNVFVKIEKAERVM